MPNETEDDDSSDAAEALVKQLLAEGHDPEMVKLVLQVRIGAMQANLDRLQWCQAIERLAVGLVALAVAREDWPTRRRSPAVADAAAPPLQIGARTESFSGLLRYEAGLNIRVTADHLQGLAALLNAQRSAVGGASLARGAFEASTWAAGLLDPTVSRDERLRRLIIRRIVRLKAGLRETDLLRGSDPTGLAAIEASAPMPDEHGSHLDARQEIADLEGLAKSRGWTVKHNSKGVDVDGPLSINWLVKNLGQGVGIEEYVWGNGSALTHAEHTPLTVSWLSLIQDTLDHSVPAWFMRLNATGSWAGPRLLLATLGAYTGRDLLLEEFKDMERLFWQNSLKN